MKDDFFLGYCHERETKENFLCRFKDRTPEVRVSFKFSFSLPSVTWSDQSNSKRKGVGLQENECLRVKEM